MQTAATEARQLTHLQQLIFILLQMTDDASHVGTVEHSICCYCKSLGQSLQQSVQVGKVPVTPTPLKVQGAPNDGAIWHKLQVASS